LWPPKSIFDYLLVPHHYYPCSFWMQNREHTRSLCSEHQFYHRIFEKPIGNHGREDREEQDKRSVPGRSLTFSPGGVERLQVSRQLWASFSSPHLAQDAFFFFNTCAFFYCFIIHMCIQGLGHFSRLPLPPSLPPTPPPPSPPTPSIPSRNYFALISNFVEERL
jgi:hypothetical protein